MVRNIIEYFFNYNLIMLIIVWWNHGIEHSPKYADIWPNKSQVFYCLRLLFSTYTHSWHSKSCTFIGWFNFSIYLTNPFQLHLYYSDAILSLIIAYYSNPFLGPDCFFNSTFASYKHALKTSPISRVCRNSPWNSECMIIQIMSWRNGVCSWYST